MTWFDWGRSPAADPPSPDVPRKLALYKYDSCPYCQRVLRKMEELGLEIELRDTLLEPGARAELVQATGGTQVPCLFIDGTPLLESADIARWLEQYAKGGARA